MPPDPPERVAETLHLRWGVAARRCEPLGSAGGFSGARLWYVEAADGDWCLKAWPVGSLDPDRLRFIHDLMREARSAGLPFVPAVKPTRAGTTFHFAADRYWDLCEWMPGRADFHDNPTHTRISAAGASLARLHRAWACLGISSGPCAAVARRLRKLAEWDDLVREGWQPDFASPEHDPVRPLAKHAWHLLPLRLERTRELLGPLRGLDLRRHPCLGDVWHDHVLFDGDRVTGIIDYGAARVDTPAVDLARLLGSLAGNDDTLYGAGLRAYQSLVPLTAEDVRLVRVLDYTGTVLGVANWLRWLYAERRHYDDRAAVARRLQDLLARL